MASGLLLQWLMVDCHALVCMSITAVFVTVIFLPVGMLEATACIQFSVGQIVCQAIDKKPLSLHHYIDIKFVSFTHCKDGSVI